MKFHERFKDHILGIKEPHKTQTRRKIKGLPIGVTIKNCGDHAEYVYDDLKFSIKYPDVIGRIEPVIINNEHICDIQITAIRAENVQCIGEILHNDGSYNNDYTEEGFPEGKSNPEDDAWSDWSNRFEKDFATFFNEIYGEEEYEEFNPPVLVITFKRVEKVR